MKKNRQIARYKIIQIDRYICETGRQIDGQIDIKTDRQIDRARKIVSQIDRWIDRDRFR